jgi:hypothetical protein
MSVSVKSWVHYLSSKFKTMCGFNPANFTPPLPTTKDWNDVDCPVCRDDKRRAEEKK